MQRRHLANLAAAVFILLSFTCPAQTLSSTPVAGFFGIASTVIGPAVMPIQLATAFKMVINGRTADHIDLDIPQAVQLRADEVIE